MVTVLDTVKNIRQPKNYIEIKNGNTLVFHFPRVHKNATLKIKFMRTLRVPDDDRVNFLPPGLGFFEMRHVRDYEERVPKEWIKHGGIVFPMFQAEAMWIDFESTREYPFAVKIGTGKICAVTGRDWSDGIAKGTRLLDSGNKENLQNYLPVPEQPWLDGFCVGKGEVRQFVAMPLGSGTTVEEQLKGQSDVGGIQIKVYPLKAEIYRRDFENSVCETSISEDCLVLKSCCSCSPMGLAEGGRIRQNIEKDEYEVTDYEVSQNLKVFAHILNSEGWNYVTGEPMPQKPVTAEDYNANDLPWFDYYAENSKPVAGSSILSKVKSINTLTGMFTKDKKVKDPENIVKLKSPKQNVIIDDSDF